MKKIFNSLMFLAVSGMLAASAHAQLVTYNFTATRTTDFGGTSDFGEKISGKVTLDLGATTSTPGDWRTGGFEISSLSDNGYTTGTGSGPTLETIFQENDEILIGNVSNVLTWLSEDGSAFRQIIMSTNSGVAGDGVPSIPNPWNVMASREKTVYISEQSLVTGDTRYAYFYISTFTSASATISIGGVDIGITDFNYQGQALSAILANLEATAKNHGDYVSSVERLAERLVRAKLLTKNQAKALTQAAAKSDIGKKPKKDKGKNGKDKNDDNDDD